MSQRGFFPFELNLMQLTQTDPPRRPQFGPSRQMQLSAIGTFNQHTTSHARCHCCRAAASPNTDARTSKLPKRLNETNKSISNVSTTIFILINYTFIYINIALCHFKFYSYTYICIIISFTFTPGAEIFDTFYFCIYATILTRFLSK